MVESNSDDVSAHYDASLKNDRSRIYPTIKIPLNPIFVHVKRSEVARNPRSTTENSSANYDSVHKSTNRPYIIQTQIE